MKTDRLYCAKEAAEIIGMNYQTFLIHARKGLIDCDPTQPRYKYSDKNIDDYIKFCALKATKQITIDCDINEAFRFLPAGPRFHKPMNPHLFEGGTLFSIGENGTVINLKTMKRIAPYQLKTGYLQVDLYNGNHATIHRLVAIMWCDNRLFKPEVHHINNNKNDNRVANLVWVTDEQHGRAHRLLNAVGNATTAQDRAEAQKEYDEYIDFIRKENREYKRHDLRLVLDTDYDYTNGNHRVYLFVTEKSYQKYLQTQNEADFEIIGQWAC